jgi:hypothetical protein
MKLCGNSLAPGGFLNMEIASTAVYPLQTESKRLRSGYSNKKEQDEKVKSRWLLDRTVPWIAPDCTSVMAIICSSFSILTLLNIPLFLISSIVQAEFANPFIPLTMNLKWYIASNAMILVTD